jgi:hypothetical protein
MTTLLPGQILGFPLICGRVVGRGNPDAPQEGMAMPASVTASVSATRQGFLPSPKKHIPGHSVTLRQPRRPPTRATTVLQPSPPSHCDPLTKTDETERSHPKPRGAWSAATREGTTSTATCGDKPDTTTGADQAPLAQPSPMAALQSTRRRPSHPQQETLHQPPGAGTEKPDLARPSPDGAQKGLDLGQDSAAAGLRAAAPPSGRATATVSPGAAAPREERSRHRNPVHRGAPPPAQGDPASPASRAGRSRSTAASTARNFARRPAPTAAKGREGEEETGGARVGGSPDLARGGRGGRSVSRRSYVITSSRVDHQDR